MSERGVSRRRNPAKLKLARKKPEKRGPGRPPNPPPEPLDESSTLELLLGAIPDARRMALSHARQLAFSDERYKVLIDAFDLDTKQDIGHLVRKHNMTPEQFLADVVKAAYTITDEAINLSKVISRGTVAAMLPKVVARGMKEAATRDGITDRHFTLQAEGFHLAPKGVQISMNQVNQTAMGLPSFEDETKDLASILGTDEVSDDHLLIEGDYMDAEITDNIEEKVLA